ncbi:MAG: hypothetical protein GKR97_17040 [Rhizobiaceae bacterium]|nr:hypothetical protein [Rhizobiaceae bacterium]
MTTDYQKRIAEMDEQVRQSVYIPLSDMAHLHRLCPQSVCRRAGACCGPPREMCKPTVHPRSEAARYMSIRMPFCIAICWHLFRDEFMYELKKDMGLLPDGDD